MNNLIRQLIVISISWYQRCISPHKGYSCAHKVLHKGESCSQCVKRVFQEQDLTTAIKLTRKRFAECGDAAHTLELQRQQESEPSLQLNAESNKPRLINRRAFIQLVLPLAFTLGLATPALAARRGIPIGGCLSAASRATVREDTRDGQCGNQPQLYFGLCCFGLIASAMAGEQK
ncbi:MAG: membrane protein insertion efficiency factor YidD [Calothrix sp. FI2-JRJ7]|nr:membrane protein insertion efficiency factor YidD [Calothrix sp. FI2-JRJ7]